MFAQRFLNLHRGDLHPGYFERVLFGKREGQIVFGQDVLVLAYFGSIFKADTRYQSVTSRTT